MFLSYEFFIFSETKELDILAKQTKFFFFFFAYPKGRADTN